MPPTSERLVLLYDVARRLATFEDLDDLVRYATRRVREVFDAEGSSILLLAGQELRFPVASLAESRAGTLPVLNEARFPADRGIAGWVLAHGEAVAIEDVAHDARFYAGVDRATGWTTRRLVAAPMRSRHGPLGVVEVVNPSGGPLGPDDAEFLDALASDIAVAYEQAALLDAVRGELSAMRRVGALAGMALALVGLVLLVGALLPTVARALPWTSVLSRPAMPAGLLALLGAALLYTANTGSAQASR
jgi:GAF domain-containing protein